SSAGAPHWRVEVVPGHRHSRVCGNPGSAAVDPRVRGDDDWPLDTRDPAPTLEWPFRHDRAPGALFLFGGIHSGPGTPMLNNLFTRIFGSRNERLLRQLQRSVDRINALEPEMEKLSDAELQAKTPEFRERIANGEALDKILPEAFAVCREASRRVLGMRHYDVQLVGGMVLHLGKIAEMRTGEGKTLVGTLPVYLNALEGRGVHVVTVNDYLARRDSAWMGKLYN